MSQVETKTEELTLAQQFECRANVEKGNRVYANAAVLFLHATQYDPDLISAHRGLVDVQKKLGNSNGLRLAEEGLAAALER